VIGWCSRHGLLSFDESSDSVDHILDQLVLRSAESSLVGDVEHAVVGFSVLAMDASDLHVESVGDLVELRLLLGKLGQLDVHRSSQGSAEVGWARGDVAQVVVSCEVAHSLDVAGSSAQSVEDLDDASALLHGDDSELVLLVDPDEEGLGVVVEDASARWPVSVEVAGLKEAITLSV